MNDDAAELACTADQFRRYVARLAALKDVGIEVVAETANDLLESYAMVDPSGCFRQSRSEGYVEISR